MTDPQPGATVPEPARSLAETPRATYWRAGILAAAILLLIIGIFVAMSPSNPDSPAIKACEAWVEDQLVAPATAKFSGESAYLTGTSPEVTGKVDAQNEFGALLRSTFSCDMSGSGNDWTVTDGFVS